MRPVVQTKLKGHFAPKITDLERPDRASPTSHVALWWFVILFLVSEFVKPGIFQGLRVQLIATLILAIAVVVTAKKRPWSPILLAQVVFFLVIAKSIPFAANNRAVWEVVYVMLPYLVLAFAVAWLMSWQKSFRWIAWAFVIIIAYCGVYAIGHGGRGPGGYVGDENDLALAMCIGLPFALFGFDHFSGWKRWACAALGLVFVAAIIASFSRGGFLGLAAVILHYLLTLGNKIRKLLLVVVAVSAFLTFAPQEYLDEIASIQEDAELDPERHTTGMNRLWLWTTAINMFKAHPIMGVGGYNYSYQAGNYQPTSGDWPSQYFRRRWSGRTTHSVYFLLLAELALPGLAVFAYIVWAHFVRLRALSRIGRKREDLPADIQRDIALYANALAGGMVGFLAAGTFISVLYYIHFWLLSAMGVALERGLRRALEPHTEPEKDFAPMPNKN